MTLLPGRKESGCSCVPSWPVVEFFLDGWELALVSSVPDRWLREAGVGKEEAVQPLVELFPGAVVKWERDVERRVQAFTLCIWPWPWPREKMAEVVLPGREQAGGRDA